MRLVKARKLELVMETMHWLAEQGRPSIVSDVLYVGPTRELVKAGRLVAFRDRAGQWCVSLPPASLRTHGSTTVTIYNPTDRPLDVRLVSDNGGPFVASEPELVVAEECQAGAQLSQAANE